MTGLRPWDRDGELPARAGEPELTPPSEAQLLELVSAHLLTPGATAPTAARWVYARWKPGVSLCSAYELQFSHGDDQLVVLKRYRGDKAAALAQRAQRGLPPSREHDDEPAQLTPVPIPHGDDSDAPPLAPSAIVPGERLHLWCEGHDRELPGQQRLGDMRRTKRLLAAQGVFAPLRLRSHRSRLSRLRYRPERRAVYRLDAALRGEDGTRGAGRLAVRALLPEVAAKVVAQRTEHGGASFLPRLLASEPRSGLLFEEWLDVSACADDDFHNAAVAATLLAQLHRPAPASPGAAVAAPSGDDPLFSWNSALADLARTPSTNPNDGPCYWTHGDFHPDQLALARDGGEPRLLDLDGLAPGDHHGDLADWIADELVARPDVDPRSAGAELLAAYADAGGPVIDRGRLSRGVQRALACRAAASLRRLEANGLAKAERTLMLARDIGEGAMAGRG